MKLDWRLPVAILMINLVGVAVEWGVISAKLDELFRDKDAQERHLEFIDAELRVRGVDAGSAKEFHDEVLRRLDAIDKKLDARR